MKKSYFVALILIIFAAGALVAYGAWLNKTSQNVITERMESRTIPLKGAKAQVREIFPLLNLEIVNLYSQDLADAVALIDGRVENIAIEKNSTVHRGQVIFTLVNDEIPIKIQQADSAIAKAQAQLANAKNNFARYKRLRERDATSQEKFDEAEANFRASEAALAEAQAVKQQLLVQSGRQDVIAPIDGEVLILYRQQGAYVQAGTPIALIGDFSRLFFSLPVDDLQAQQLTIGQSAELRFKRSQIIRKAYDTEFAAGNLGDEQIFPVVVRDIMPPLNQPASLRKVLWEIDNRVGLLEQQAYSGVSLKSMIGRKLLSVPIDAMIDSAKNSVFVVTAQNTLERRTVKTGVDDGSFIEIINGLKDGEIVVTSASDGLHDGMKVELILSDN